MLHKAATDNVPKKSTRNAGQGHWSVRVLFCLLSCKALARGVNRVYT